MSNSKDNTFFGTLCLIVLFLIIIGFIFGYFTFSNYGQKIIKYDIPCLNEIAVQTCSLNNLSLSEVYEQTLSRPIDKETYYYGQIECKGFSREKGYLEQNLFFTKEELEACLLK